HHGDLSYVKAFREYSSDTRGDYRVTDLYIFFGQGEFQGTASSTFPFQYSPCPGPLDNAGNSACMVGYEKNPGALGHNFDQLADYSIRGDYRHPFSKSVSFPAVDHYCLEPW